MKLSRKDEESFKEFAIDHIEHFDAIPCEFETAGGKVLTRDECWDLAKELNLEIPEQ